MGDLVAFAIYGLREVSLAIEDADRDEGETEVAGRLAVITGQDAQPAGVERDALVNTEFGAEVGDEVPLRIEQPVDLRAHPRPMVGIVAGEDSVEVLHVDPVLGSLLEPLLRDPAQEHLGIVAALFPEVAIEAEEQRTDLPIPAVEQIVGQLVEARQRFGKPGLDLQRVAGARHRKFS